MGRNKLIYAMADYGLVVSAEYNKGGTWAGAKEELKRDNALTVFVRQGADHPSGNVKLVGLGAVEWPESLAGEGLAEQHRRPCDRSCQKGSARQYGFF